MSQWAEVRHLHLVEKVPKKEIARRLQLDVKTVRRAVDQQAAPVRVSPPRARGLDPWREQIAQWLGQDRRLTAKRIRPGLNHPSIAQIHGLEEQDGIKALVLELVEGPTLQPI